MKKFFFIWILCFALVFGTSLTPTPETLNGVFTFSASTSGESFGKSVSNAGDINNDGYDDFIIGAPSSSPNIGKAYIIYGGANLTPSNFDIATTPLDFATTGFTITGKYDGGLFGFSVSGAGDLDDDGFDDIIIGEPAGNSGKGVVYVIFGGPKLLLPDLDLQAGSLPAGSGFTITGEATQDQVGYSVSSAGDVNNDGHDDIIIGAMTKTTGAGPQTGAAHVIYGGPRSSLTDIDLANALDPLSRGFSILGSATKTYFGASVSSAGDVNKDGHDDVIIGARGDADTKGVVYVFYGKPETYLHNRDLSTDPLILPEEGFTITAPAANYWFGSSVSGIGSIDGDDYDDIIIGAYAQDSYKGAVYVIYGGENNVDIDLSTDLLTANSNGFTIAGEAANDYFGCSVSNATDVNGDGFSDILIGAYTKASSTGAAYVIYGGGDRIAFGNIDLVAGLDITTQGFAVSGVVAGGRFGISVSNAGDVNGDGFGDIIIGANANAANKAYLLTYNRCPDHCSTCSVPSKCDSCPIGFDLSSNNECVCPSGYYPSGTTCAACSDNCKTCTNYTTCTECMYAYYFHHGKCYGSSCPIKSFEDPENGYNCLDCPSNCDVCTMETMCITCTPPFLRYLTQCYTECPAKTFAASSSSCQDCSSNCETCESASVCTACTSPSLLYQNKCVSSCPSTYFVNSGVCSACPSNCNVCSNETTCTTCSTGYYLWDSSCYNPCPTGAFLAGATSTSCTACPSDCDQCSSGSVCSVCSQGYFLYQDQCFSSCPAHTFTSGNACIDCKQNCARCTDGQTCQSCEEGYLFSGPDCVDHCPVGFYPSGDVCHACSTGCYECTSESNCQACSPGYVNFKSHCLTGCPAKTYLSNSACFDCSEGCLKCTSGTECQTCEDGFMLSESHSCVQHFEEKAKDKAGPALFESTSLISASVTSGSSLPLNFGLVAKILRNIKYMDLAVSPELQNTFYSWKVASGFMSAPDSLRENTPPKGLPYVFGRYALEPVFLVNFWKPFMMTIIGFVLFVIFKGLEIKFEKDKKGKIYSISRQINVIASNFALTQFYSNLDDVILYVAIQLRSTQYDSAFGAFSFGVAIIFSAIGIIILSFHSSLLGKYQSLKKEQQKSQSIEAFTQKYENYKLVFADFKDTNYLTQSFLFFNLLRALLSSLIIVTLYQYPGLQVAFLLILNLAMLTLLLIKKPFKELVDTCGQIFCELVLLVANISVMILLVCDKDDSGSENIIERLSQCIIVLNFILLFGCAVLLLVSVGKMIWKAYQDKKNEKKSIEKSANIKNLFDSAKFTRPSQSLENKTDQSLMPMATNDISGELFNNASRVYQNNHSPDLSYNQSVTAFESPNLLFKQEPLALSESFVVENPLDFESHPNSRKQSNEQGSVIESNLKLVNEVGETDQEKVVHKNSMDQSIRRRRILRNNRNGDVSVDVSPQINSKKLNVDQLKLDMDVINLDDDVLEN